MLQVVFFKDSQNRLSSIFAGGHAEAGEYGKDVVCAAVSGILQAARLGLEAHAKISLEVVQEPGEFRLSWPTEARASASVEAIVATAELAIRQIAAQYPNHVGVKTKALPELPGQKTGKNIRKH